MNRFCTIAAASLAAAALLGACREPSPPAATVNGVDISADDLVDELEAIGANGAYLEAQEAALAESGGRVLGSEEGTFDTAFVAQILRLRILYAVLADEIATRDVEISDACREAATSLAEEQAGGAETFAGFTEEYRDELVEREAQIAALSADLAGLPCRLEEDEALVEAYFEEHREQFDRRCVSVIQVADQAGADQVFADLAAGTAFATVAQQRSLEAETAAAGGSIGCFAPDELNPEISTPMSALGAGEVSAVIPFQDSFVILRVDELQPATFESQRDAVVTAIGAEVDAGFQEWANETFTTAEVTVDERYGTWNGETLMIDRPVDESPQPEE